MLAADVEERQFELISVPSDEAAIQHGRPGKNKVLE
jgi:hypothetical protein